MQLKYNRMRLGLILVALTGIDWAVIAFALNGVDLVYAMGAMAALMAVALVILLLMIRPPVLARLESDTLRVGRGKAHLADVMRVGYEDGALTFAVRARDADGHWAGAYGERLLALRLGRVDGGRKAADRFVALVEAARQAIPPLPVEEPPAPPPPRLHPRRDGIDPDVRPPLERPAGPARAGFGRKGL